MRRRFGVAAFVVLAVLVAGGLWLAQDAQEVAAGELQREAGSPASVSERAPSPDSLEWATPALSAEELAMPGGTPALKNPATDRDGHLVITVRSQGRPVEAAKVRVYLRGPTGTGGTNLSQWRLAGGGSTDAAGLLRVAARPGKYVVAVRREGLATALREVTRLAGEPETHVSIGLEPGGVLRGRVVERGGNEPVPLAELELARFTVAATGAIDSPLEETRHSAANERGRFEIAGLEPGTYQLQVTAPGHARSSQSVTLPRASELVISLSGASGIEGRVLLADGKPASNAEVIAIGTESAFLSTGAEGTFAGELLPGTYALSARLGGETGALADPVVVAQARTVTGLVITLGKAAALEGVVIAKATKAPVAGARVHLSPFHGEGVMGETLTGPDGRFAIEGLAPGAYDLGTDAEGFSPYARTGISVTAAQRFPLVIELGQLASVSGVVRDAAGAPAPQVRVEAVRMWGTSAFTWGPNHETLTGADGTFQFPQMEVGRIRISAGPTESAGWRARQLITVEEGKASQVELTLRGVGTVTGRVTAKGGGPLPKEVLVRSMPSPWVMAGEERFVATGADGRYTMELVTGRFVLHVVPADTPNAPARPPGVTVVVEADQTIERDLELPDDASRDTLLSGNVLEPNGTPSPGAYVLAGEGMLTARNGNRYGNVTDERGTFELYRRSAADPSVLDVVASNGGRIAMARGVRAGTTLDLPLKPGGKVSGTVTGLAENELYRVGYEVKEPGLPQWTNDPPQFSGSTFQLNEVPAVRVRITVTTERGNTGSEELVVASAGIAHVTIAVEASATVSGRLTDGKAPVASAHVQIGGKGIFPAPGTDGRFEVTHVSKGTHLLEAFAQGFMPAERTITVEAGGRLDVGDWVMTRRVAEPGTIGVSWGPSGTEVVSAYVLPESPGDRAGVRGGDVLVAIDRERVTSAADAEARVKGAPGSTVHLSLRRGTTPLELDVVRAGAVTPRRNGRSSAQASR